MTSQDSETVHTKPRTINARFYKQLPSIIEHICEGLNEIEPHIDQIAVYLREFQDYLDFEISKAVLEIEKQEWQPKCDQIQLKLDKDWLAQLKSLRSDFDGDILATPFSKLSDIIRRVEKVLGVVTVVY